MLLSARVCCQCFHGIVVLVLLMFATIALATTADILYCLFPLCLMILYDMIVVGDVRTPPIAWFGMGGQHTHTLTMTPPAWCTTKPSEFPTGLVPRQGEPGPKP